jgi:hypothetical protein
LQGTVLLQAAQLKHWAAARFAFEAALAVNPSNVISLEVCYHLSAAAAQLLFGASVRCARGASSLKCTVAVLQGALNVVLQLGDWQAAETVAGALATLDCDHPHAAAVLQSLQQPDHR